MQKLTVTLLLIGLIASALAVNNRKFAQITDGMRCKLCLDVAEHDAKWSKLDTFKEESTLLTEAFKLCDSVFHEGFEELERLVCDDFATHSAPIVREHKSMARFGKNSPKDICKSVGFCA